MREIREAQDGGARTRALAEFEARLRVGEPEQVRRALAALPGLSVLEFDKAPFRALALHYFDSEDPLVRAAALKALPHTQLRSEDAGLLRIAASDTSSDVRAAAGSMLVRYTRGDLARVESVALDLLADPDARVARDTLRGLAGGVAPHDLEHALLLRACDPALRYETVYYALARLTSFGSESAMFLLGEVRSGQAETRELAARALVGGVRPLDRRVVARHAGEQLDAATQPAHQRRLIEILVALGAPAEVPVLERLCTSESADANIRAAAQRASRMLRTRDVR